MFLSQAFLHFDFAGQLADDAASKLAFVFVSRGFDEWPLLRDRIRGILRPCNDDNGSKHTLNSHSEVQDIFGLYTQQYASTTVSYQHNVVLLDTVHHRVDISRHASIATIVAVDVAILAAGPILVDFH